MALELFQIQHPQTGADEVVEHQIISTFVVVVTPGVDRQGQPCFRCTLGIHILAGKYLDQICGAVVDHIIRILTFHADVTSPQRDWAVG